MISRIYRYHDNPVSGTDQYGDVFLFIIFNVLINILGEAQPLVPRPKKFFKSRSENVDSENTILQARADMRVYFFALPFLYINLPLNLKFHDSHLNENFVIPA